MKLASTVGTGASTAVMLRSRNGINSWKVHQLVGMYHKSNTKMASNCWNVHQHVQLWQSLFGCGQNQFGPFLLWENETKFVNGEKICINSWNVHQLVGISINVLEFASMCWNLHQLVGISINVLELRLKISSTVGKCINLLEL
jgi:hypothetical protein